MLACRLYSLRAVPATQLIRKRRLGFLGKEAARGGVGGLSERDQPSTETSDSADGAHRRDDARPPPPQHGIKGPRLRRHWRLRCRALVNLIHRERAQRQEMKTQRGKPLGPLLLLRSSVLSFAQPSWPALRKRDASCYNANGAKLLLLPLPAAWRAAAKHESTNCGNRADPRLRHGASPLFLDSTHGREAKCRLSYVRGRLRCETSIRLFIIRPGIHVPLLL